MSVTGPGTKLLFCEGGMESLDVQLLNRLLLGRTGTLIVPAGGKQGLRSFIDGHLASFAPYELPEFLAFRDRDFDALPPDTPRLNRLSGEKPIFLSYRPCIESYLLDADLIVDYWTKHERTPRWCHGPSPGRDEILDWINKAAEDILHYQTVRWALARLKQSDRWPEVRTTWTKGSGYLPPSRAQDACRTEGRKLVTCFIEDARKVSTERFEREVDCYAKRFLASNFWERRDYLIWFHGKDLKASMQKLRPNHISMNHFCSWAVEHLAWPEHADLRELADRI